MRVGILTFQFAHNYGALLQAYALRTFLKQNGTNVEFIPYYPVRFQKEYEINPFVEGLSFKQRVAKIIKYKMKKPSYDRFKLFKEKELNIKACISKLDSLKQYLENFDVIIFGSDQIWNTELTENDFLYFGKDVNNKKISYAASLGTDKLLWEQNEGIRRYLDNFEALSVREEHSRQIIGSLLNRQCYVTVDPVFLLSSEQWNDCKAEMEINRPYMIVYMLEDDIELKSYAKEYAMAHELDIYEIHPIRGNRHKEFCQLVDVGPKEFISLIRNAEIVCTNSFHAVSFSIIFEKKCLHLPNCKSSMRTVSLLHLAGINLKGNNEMPIYEFNEATLEKMMPLIGFSKKFLQNGILTL